MAFVKTKYVRGKARIKAHLRYITHRRGMEGERMSRPLFGPDGPLSKLQIYDMIDATGRGVVFHKFVFNFHPVKEDTRKDLNLWEITKKPWNTSKHNSATACRLSPRSMTTTPCFGMSTGFSLFKGNSQKKNSRKYEACGRLPRKRCVGSAGVLTACMRVGGIKNYCRLSKSTNANTSRGGEGGCEQSGCSRPVSTAAMGACPACRHIF